MPKKSKKPKVFRVYAESTSILYLDVKAKNEEEAEEIAFNADGGDFHDTEDGSWEIMQGCTERVK